MYKKEENFKEKFRQALISTAKVISDDYKPLKNKKKKLDTNSFELLELEDLNDINDFIKFRAESDSAALKKNFLIKKYTKKIFLIAVLVEVYTKFRKKLDMNFLAVKCSRGFPKI